MPGTGDDFDIVRILAGAVAPALTAVFKPGEVQSVHLVCESSVALPDGSESKPTELNLHLTCNGERFQSNIWVVSDLEYDEAQLKEKLIAEFADFVAELNWGWGQQRP